MRTTRFSAALLAALSTLSFAFPSLSGATDSCDGADIVTDAAGDAVNPAPGGQGPTTQADILSVSFDGRSSPSSLFTTIKVSNLSRTPSPGTSFTSYYVIWTSTNGKVYATELDMDASTVAAEWGEWDAANQQITDASFTTATGTIITGVNGTVTVPVPLSGIGNPAIPIIDPTQTPAVRNVTAMVKAGIGVIGSGLVYNAHMDDASGGANRAFVCQSLTPPVEGDPCILPGVTLLSDGLGDSTNPFGLGTQPNPAWDITKVSVGEPFAVAPGKVAFTIKTQSLAQVPPNTRWPIQFRTQGDPAGVGRWVDMRSDAGGAVTFMYGCFTVTPSTGAYAAPTPSTGTDTCGSAATGGTVTVPVSAADAASSFNADGTIKIVVARNKIGLAGSPTDLGKKLRGFLVRVREGNDTAASTPDNSPDTLATDVGTYTLGGNNYCAPAPHVDDLAATPTSGNSPLMVNFTGTAHANSVAGADPSNTLTSYTFDFGDGSAEVTQAGNTTSHSYTAGCAVTRSAKLTVIDSRGYASDNSKSAPITVTTVNQAPVPALAINPASPDTLDTVELNAGATSDPNTCDTIVSYTFDFGDGTAPVTQASSIATHNYAVGNYTATVTATDNATPPLTSSPPASVSFTVTPPTNHAPVAKMKATTPTLGPAPLTVDFDASESYDPDATRTSDYVDQYDFDYGDGTPVDTKTVPAASHQYTVPGIYHATLHVLDHNGGLGSAADFMIDVNALNTPPAPQLTATPDTIAKGTSTMLDASGTTDLNGDSVVEYTFNPGDGTGPVSQASPVFNHVYTRGGTTFVASVVAKDSRGGVSATPATTSVTVVDQAPTAVFNATPTSGPAPLTVTLDGAGSTDPDVNDSVAAYVFDFGDGSDPVTRVGGTTVQHIYATAGPHTARLRVADQDGVLSAEKTLLITVSSVDNPPLARLTSNKTSGDPPLTVAFDAGTSTDPDGDAITQYTFDFGDGTAPVSQAGPTVEHKYMTAGRYVALVTVTDAKGAQSSNSDSVTITATAPPPEVNANETPGGGLSPGLLLGLTLLGSARRRRRSRASD